MLNRIKELRIERRLTQEQLARRIGTSQQTQSDIENNKIALTADMLIVYCDFFCISSDYLLNRSDCKIVKEDIDDIYNNYI